MPRRHITLNPSLDEKLRQYAEEEGEDMSTIIRDALKEYFYNKEVNRLKVEGLRAVVNE